MRGRRPRPAGPGRAWAGSGAATLIHRLLQLLPDLAPGERPPAAERLLAAGASLDDAEQRAEMAAAALGVLDDPMFAEVFGPGIAARGRRRRRRARSCRPGWQCRAASTGCVIPADRVLVVDFKTNRPAPGRIEDADPAYVLQMAVYAAVLGEVFPGRRESRRPWSGPTDPS